MRTLILLLALSAALSTASVAHAAPVAQQGALDLSSVHLTDEGPVDIRGNWRFYPGVFVQPEELLTQSSSDLAERDSRTLDIDSYGHGTYHLEIALSERDADSTLALRIPLISSAYVLYVDGKQHAPKGRLGDSVDAMKPAGSTQMFYFTPQKQNLELTLHVSNYSQRTGGSWDQLRLGTAGSMAQEYARSLLVQVFFASGLLLVGIYHISLHAVRPSRSALFFGLACLSMCLRTVVVGDIWPAHISPIILWEAAVKIEYMSVLCGFAFLVLYFYYLYERMVSRTVTYVLASVSIALCVPVLVLPAKVYTEWAVFIQILLLVQVIYILYGQVRAVSGRRPGSVVNMAASLVFLATVINDMVYFTFQFETVELVLVGLFLFIIAQMYMLSRKYASAHEHAERLRDELAGVNDNLEAIVSDRTAELRTFNERLERSQQSRTTMLSHITHELGNPLTSVIGYLRRLRDGVPKEMEARHVQIAYQKSLKLEHLMQDLRQLSTLERGQFSYHPKTFGIHKLYAELQAVYDWDLLDRRFSFRLHLPKREGYAIHADLQRLEQVFLNLINNAIAHTAPGGSIEISMRCFPFARACAIAVRDEGEGIPEEELERIFDRFYRVNSAPNEKYEGSGLGLPISKAIVEAHGGKIGVRSVYGQGSVFYFILPVVKENVDEAVSNFDR